MQSELYLDGIVTVIDAKYISKYLKLDKKNEINEATKQIALADRLVLNKTDLVDQEELTYLEGQIRSINQVARLTKSLRGK